LLCCCSSAHLGFSVARRIRAQADSGMVRHGCVHVHRCARRTVLRRSTSHSCPAAWSSVMTSWRARCCNVRVLGGASSPSAAAGDELPGCDGCNGCDGCCDVAAVLGPPGPPGGGGEMGEGGVAAGPSVGERGTLAAAGSYVPRNQSCAKASTTARLMDSSVSWRRRMRTPQMSEARGWSGCLASSARRILMTRLRTDVPLSWGRAREEEQKEPDDCTSHVFPVPSPARIRAHEPIVKVHAALAPPHSGLECTMLFWCMSASTVSCQRILHFVRVVLPFPAHSSALLATSSSLALYPA